MSTVLEIEKAIGNLPRAEYGILREWIENYNLDRDRTAASAQIEAMLDDEDGGEDQISA